MVQSNEFTADTLELAIKKATFAYAREKLLESKDICSDLAFDLADFKRAAGDALNKAEILKRESEALGQSARQAGLEVLLNAAIAASGGFGTAARALRKLKNLKLKDLSRNEWLSLIPVFGGGFAAAFNAYKAVRDSAEARKLALEAQSVLAEADRLGDDIVRIANEYRRAGCGASRQTS